MPRLRLKSSWSASTRSSRICSRLAILRCSLSVEPGAGAEVDGIPPRPAVASGDCGLTPRAGQDGAPQSLLAVCRDPRRRQPQACHRGRIQRQTRQRSQAAPWSACPLLHPNGATFVPFRCTRARGGATVFFLPFFLPDRFGGHRSRQGSRQKSEREGQSANERRQN